MRFSQKSSAPKSPVLKRMVSYTVAACTLIGVSGVASAASAKDELLIGTDLTYPPYNMMVDGKAAGFDPDFMNALSAEAGLTPVYKDTRFANLVIGVSSGQFDVIASTLYVTQKRAEKIDYLAYMKTGGVLIAKSNAAVKPKTPKDLCGLRVSNITGGAWIEKLNKVSADYCEANGKKPIDIREFPTSPEGTQALLSGAVDVQYEDAAVSASVVKMAKGRLEITSETVLYPVVVGLGFKKGNDALRAKLTTALDALKTSGKYDALLKSYELEAPSAAEIAKALGQ